MLQKFWRKFGCDAVGLSGKAEAESGGGKNVSACLEFGGMKGGPV